MQKTMRPFLFNPAVRHCVIAAVTAVTSLSLLADDKDKVGKDKESTFLNEAIQCNLVEVKLGQLASTKAENAEVKRYGERLVTDHQKANDELKQLAEKRGVTTSADLDAKHQKMLDKFQGYSGAEFDKEFAKHMIKDHKKAVAKFEKAAKECEDAEVRSFVQRTLPSLREHLRSAQTMARSVGLDEAAITTALREADTEAAGGAAAESEIGKGEKKDEKKDN